MKEIVYVLHDEDTHRYRKMVVSFMESIGIPATVNNREVTMNDLVSYRFLTPHQASIACGIRADTLIIDRTVMTYEIWKEAKQNMAPRAKEIIYI